MSVGGLPSARRLSPHFKMYSVNGLHVGRLLSFVIAERP
jgi:hypothetical protein